MEYEIIYSKRKSVSLIVRNGILTVRAPEGLKKERIAEIVIKHESWIIKNLALDKEKNKKERVLSEAEIKELKKAAEVYFNCESKKIAEKMGLKYGRIKITSAKRRFGSCSSDKNICFSYRLMLYPIEARVYVIVHELCHLVYMNHSKDFYTLLEKHLPDYKERKRLLV